MSWLRIPFRAIRKSVGAIETPWSGATVGSITAAALALAAMGWDYLAEWGQLAGALIGGTAVFAGATAIAIALLILIRLLSRIPALFLATSLASGGVLGLALRPFNLGAGAWCIAAVVICVGIAAGAVAERMLDTLKSARSARYRRFSFAAMACALIAGSAWVWLRSDGVARTTNSERLATELSNEAIESSVPGSPAFRELSYSSGADRRDPHEGGTELLTQPVDGSRLLGPDSSMKSALRRSYWRFSNEALPLNGHVWYPSGSGPYPLVLIVHGNHMMHVPSERGYAYLGESLASRGFIVATVDQNFLNVAPLRGFDLTDENDARAWLTLRHLDLWRRWNADPSTPFHERVDLARVGLIGHSRGGEAVMLAAAFNGLSRHPDDGDVTFDNGFGIRSLVALAPVNGQFRPGGRDVTLSDVSLLILHGSHDADLGSFEGIRIFNRTKLGPQHDQVKIAAYLVGANHAQFNSMWGDDDLLGPLSLLLDPSELISAREQRNITLDMVSAFLDATLRGRDADLDQFRAPPPDSDRPQSRYITQFRRGDDRILCDYEEDLDLSTASLPGARLHAEDLTLWREQALELRGGDARNSAVLLAWDNSVEPGMPSYRVELPPAFDLSGAAALIFSLADGRHTIQNPSSERLASLAARISTIEADSFDFTIEIVDRAANVARLPLSLFGKLPLVHHPSVYRFAWLGREPSVETVFQSFEIPMHAFERANPALESSHVESVRFVFDLRPVGALLVDDVGFRSARVSEAW